jgi:hypothetical protein
MIDPVHLSVRFPAIAAWVAQRERPLHSAIMVTRF